jgi:hypothetical protein
MPDQLVEFLRSKKREHAADQNIDWQRKRDVWVQSVNSLYNQVGRILADSINSGDVTVDQVEMQIAEDFVGTYSIPKLELNVGGERVEFRPMGVTVIGASGRVDIRGERDVVTLLKGEVGVENEWLVVLQRTPYLNTQPLDSETLKYALERVMLPLI